MRKILLLLAAGALAVCFTTPSFAEGTGFQVGITVGPTWAMSGDSFILDPVDPGFSQPNSFKDDFDLGWSIGGYVAGPISGMFGWRGEFGYEKMSADADRATGGRVDGDYKLFRYQGGIQIADFQGSGKGKPYGFFTLGGVFEDATLNADLGGAELQYDFDGSNAFGLSFGGGYNYLVGESWGLGGDLHINAGFFDDSTRWWWTPSAQVFFSF